MKRFIYFIAISLMLLIASNAMAAGSSLTPSLYARSHDGLVMVFKLACVGDDSTGAVPATQITAALLNWSNYGFRKDYWQLGYYLYEVWVVVGGTAPDLADIAITDSLAATLYTEANVIPISGTNEGAVDKYRTVTSPITVTVSNQGTADATFDIYIKLSK